MRIVFLLSVFALACSSEPTLEGALRGAADEAMAAAVISQPPEETFTLEEVAAVETEPEGGGVYKISVLSGETLTLYGSILGVIPEAIAEKNGLDPYGKLQVGQALEIELGELTAARFEEKRKAWRARRVARYLEKRGGVHTVREHTVRRGETVLGIARRYGRLPHWIMRHYNPDRDLDTLDVGDTVRVPVTSDRVVSSR